MQFNSEIMIAKISVDNGRNFLDAAEAMPIITKYKLWDVVVAAMDDG